MLIQGFNRSYYKSSEQHFPKTLPTIFISTSLDFIPLSRIFFTWTPGAPYCLKLYFNCFFIWIIKTQILVHHYLFNILNHKCNSFNLFINYFQINLLFPWSLCKYKLPTFTHIVYAATSFFSFHWIEDKQHPRQESAQSNLELLERITQDSRRGDWLAQVRPISEQGKHTWLLTRSDSGLTDWLFKGTTITLHLPIKVSY